MALTDQVEVFDPGANHWQRVRDLPTPLGGPGVAVHNGRIFVVGWGEPAGIGGFVHIYDPSFDSYGAGRPAADASDRRLPGRAQTSATVSSSGTSAARTRASPTSSAAHPMSAGPSRIPA